MDGSRVKLDVWSIAKALSLVAFVAVICVKIYKTPMSITVDFPTLLSLLLAIFSVGLAALFYFKATDTSNTFYDNTYKFTRDIAQLLAKIESGFGERLKHLDEGYAALRDSFHNGDRKEQNSGIIGTKQKLEEEKLEVRKVREDRNRIVSDLLAKSQMEQAEKTAIAQQLKEKEKELESAQQEVTKLNHRLLSERLRRRAIANDTNEDNEGMNHFSRNHVVRRIGERVLFAASSEEIIMAFERLVDNLPRSYIRDLERRGYYEGLLTERGVEYLRSVAREEDA